MTNFSVVIIALVGMRACLLARPRAILMLAIAPLFLTVAILSEATSWTFNLCICLMALVRVWNVLWWRIRATSPVTGRNDSV